MTRIMALLRLAALQTAKRLRIMISFYMEAGFEILTGYAESPEG